MKWQKIFIVSLLSILFFSCEADMEIFYDDTPPATPTNIRTFTGDNMIEISWKPVYNSDLAGYAVYWSDSYDGKYSLIGTTVESCIIDYDAANGLTTYYAVAAYDINGNESELSYDVAYDTPRPEGFDNPIYDFYSYPHISGYNFASYQLTAFNSEDADFFFENDNGTSFLYVWEDTDIQNMGPTFDIYDISAAPLTGWEEQMPGVNVKFVEAIVGCTYVIWTWDDHFAKIRIQSITHERLTFDWAYQIAEGNIELKINRNGEKRVKLPNKVISN